MDTHSLISVIIPVSAPSDTLRDSICSVAAQSWTDLEILVAAWGADPALQEQLRPLAELSDKVKLLPVAASRTEALNEALTRSQGEYIHICSGAEKCKPEMYSTLIAQLEEKQADMICFPWLDSTAGHAMCGNISDDVGDGQGLLKMLLTDPGARDDYSGYGAALWNKLFRRSLVFLYGDVIPFASDCGDIVDFLWLSHICLGCGSVLFSELPLMERGTVTEASEDLTVLSVETLFEREKQVLMMTERVFPALYDTMCRYFYRCATQLIQRMIEQKLIRRAERVRQLAMYFYPIEWGESEVLDLHLRILNLEKDRAWLKRRADSLTGKIDILEENRQWLQKKTGRLEEQCQKMETQRQQLETQRQQLESKLESAGKDRKWLQGKVNDLNAEIAVFERDKAHLTGEIARLEASQDKLLAEVAGLQSETAQLLISQNALIVEKEKLLCELAHLHEVRAELLAQTAAQESKIDQMRSAQETLLVNKEGLENKVSELLTAVGGLETQRDALTAEVSRLQAVENSLLTAQMTLQEEVSFLSDKVELLGKDRAWQKSKIQRLEERQKVLHDDREWLRAKSNRLEAELVAYKASFLVRVGWKLHRFGEKLRNGIKRLFRR